MTTSLYDELAMWEPRTDDGNTAAFIAHAYWEAARRNAAKYDRWLDIARREREDVRASIAAIDREPGEEHPVTLF